VLLTILLDWCVPRRALRWGTVLGYHDTLTSAWDTSLTRCAVNLGADPVVLRAFRQASTEMIAAGRPVVP
jgi:hypothetical protein